MKLKLTLNSDLLVSTFWVLALQAHHAWFYVVLWIEPIAECMLGKHSTHRATYILASGLVFKSQYSNGEYVWFSDELTWGG